MESWRAGKILVCPGMHTKGISPKKCVKKSQERDINMYLKIGNSRNCEYRFSEMFFFSTNFTRLATQPMDFGSSNAQYEQVPHLYFLAMNYADPSP